MFLLHSCNSLLLVEVHMVDPQLLFLLFSSVTAMLSLALPVESGKLKSTSRKISLKLVLSLWSNSHQSYAFTGSLGDRSKAEVILLSLHQFLARRQGHRGMEFICSHVLEPSRISQSLSWEAVGKWLSGFRFLNCSIGGMLRKAVTWFSQFLWYSLEDHSVLFWDSYLETQLFQWFHILLISSIQFLSV